MNEETMKVLKMLEEGKIDSEKAGELIDALTSPKNIVPAPVTANSDKILKIKVNSHKGDNVNINVPVKFINTLGTAIKKMPKVEGTDALENIDIKAILQAVSEGLDGKIMDVQSEQGDIVEIIVE